MEIRRALAGHFHDYGRWPWAHFNSLERQLTEHPTFVICEFLFIGLALLSLWHACTAAHSARRRLKLLWSLSFIVGSANDYFFMLLPVVDTFWQAQAVIMLTPRMPLYIPCVCNAFMYWSTMAAARVFRYRNKCAMTEASLAGLLGGILYAVYDICGARFLWWTWHGDDASVRLRWLGVPASSTTWSIVFVFCFAWLFGKCADAGSGAVATLATCMLTTPLMMVLMTPFTILGNDTIGLIGPSTAVVTTAFFAAVVCYRLAVPSRQLPVLRMPLPEEPAVGMAVAFYFACMAFVAAFFSPEAQVSTGVHQRFGSCSAVETDMFGFNRTKYLCRDGYPSEWFSLDCLPGSGPPRRWEHITPEQDMERSVQRLASWYTICGTPHQSWIKWTAAVAALGLVGTLMYLGALRACTPVNEGWVARNPPARQPSVRGARRQGSPRSAAAAPVGRDGRLADAVVTRADRRPLTETGEWVKTLLDPLLCPIVDRHWVLVHQVLVGIAIALMFLTGGVLNAVFPSGTSGQWLQGPYEWVRSLGLGYAGHPVFLGFFSIASYAGLVSVYTAVDFWRPQFVKDVMVTPRDAGDFGGPGLGLRRALETQVRFTAYITPFFVFQVLNAGPKLYQRPWLEPCLVDCPLTLPDAAPSVLEFLVHSSFCVVAMDACYWYYHWMLHRHRALYRNVHALHHEYRAPFALVTQHAHPLELLATGSFSVVAPMACGAHPFTTWFWIFISILISIEAHSGYQAPLGLKNLTLGLFGGTIHHDVHHQSPWCNYEPFLCYLDKLCGTDADGKDGHAPAPELEGAGQ